MSLIEQLVVFVIRARASAERERESYLFASVFVVQIHDCILTEKREFNIKYHLNGMPRSFKKLVDTEKP